MKNRAELKQASLWLLAAGQMAHAAVLLPEEQSEKAKDEALKAMSNAARALGLLLLDAKPSSPAECQAMVDYFQNKGGALGMLAGDRVVYDIDGRHGVALDFLQDGDAYVTFDDGSKAEVKWNHLTKESR